MAAVPRAKKRRKMVVGVCVAAAIIILVVITFRPGWSRSSTFPADGTVETPEYSVEYQASAANFELRPKRDGVDVVIAELRRAFSLRVEDLGIIGNAANHLEDTLVKRVEMQLSPDFETWKAIVGDKAPPGANPEHPDHDKFQRIWHKKSGLFRQSPIDLDSMVVRRIEPDAGPRIAPEYDAPGTRFLRSGGSYAPTYPDPENGSQSIEMVETLLPMQYKMPGHDPLPVTVSFRFYRNNNATEWKPTDLYLYFDKEAFGKGLVLPIN